jgi:hypothetical protein
MGRARLVTGRDWPAINCDGRLNKLGQQTAPTNQKMPEAPKQSNTVRDNLVANLVGEAEKRSADVAGIREVFEFALNRHRQPVQRLYAIAWSLPGLANLVMMEERFPAMRNTTTSFRVATRNNSFAFLICPWNPMVPTHAEKAASVPHNRAHHYYVTKLEIDF